MQNINLIGKAKNTKLEDSINEVLNNEIYYAAALSALSNICKNENYEDTATSLEEMAMDKIRSAGRYALLNGMVSDDIVKSLYKLLEHEKNSLDLVNSLANKSKELGLKDIENVINEEFIAEKNYVNDLKELISKHDKKLSKYLLQRSRSDYQY
ncbi:hypothetical protein [Clostridium sp. CCUG 7971]|uniref:hypothetical protein n=1 Tax=Clostridium sp. CCUG 7971 TaxID=2811414 RepID=UPI001ABABBD9|nr:hypothetical protein [Clostridium sp. CCUG 7971]MBO3445243.1 hypothetical protein [Clostridium sp. CCUG 7971]